MSNLSSTLPPPPESDSDTLRVKLLTLDNLHKLNSLLRAFDVARSEYTAPDALVSSLDARVQEWLEEHYGSAPPPSEAHRPCTERDDRPTQRVADCARTWPPAGSEVDHV